MDTPGQQQIKGDSSYLVHGHVQQQIKGDKYKVRKLHQQYNL